MSSVMDYDEYFVNLLAARVGKEAAKRYLRIKRIDLKLSFIKPQDKVLDVGVGLFKTLFYFRKWAVS